MVIFRFRVRVGVCTRSLQALGNGTNTLRVWWSSLALPFEWLA